MGTDYFEKVQQVMNMVQKHWWVRLFLGKVLMEGLLGLFIRYSQMEALVVEEQIKVDCLRNLCSKLIGPIQDVGDREEWSRAADTSREYTWDEFQELHKLLEVTK